MAFLWNGSDLKHTGAKVKWDQICSPKDEGGLGFRKIKEWNKATILRHLWAICKKADSLWVKWVHTYIIKNQSLWHMSIPSDASWSIRKIFGMRNLGQPLIQYKVGNGQSIFLWVDNWHPLGPLYKRYGEDVVYNLGRSLHARVFSIIHRGQWRWPRARNRIIQSIINHTPANFLPDCANADQVVWLPSSNGAYSAKSAWEAVRTKFPVKPWTKVVWFKTNVPRWAFILWLAAQGKLNTKDRLCKWGMTVDEICPLCCCEKESHQHLFFGCSYAQVVWNTVWCKTSSTRGPNTLADLLEWFVHNVKGEGFKCRILKCSLAAAVYFIWRERNLRVFQQKSMASDQVAQSAVNSIRDFLSSMRRVKPSMVNRVLCTKWGLAEHYILNRQSE